MSSSENHVLFIMIIIDKKWFLRDGFRRNLGKVKVRLMIYTIDSTNNVLLVQIRST